MEAQLKYLDAEERQEMEAAEIEYNKSRYIFAYSLPESAKKEIRLKRDNERVYLVEQILIQLIEGVDGDLDFRGKLFALNLYRSEDKGSSDKLWSVDSVRRSVLIFKAVHAIRLAYSKQCFVGFVGPQNAGKSTLLNNLFDKNAETGTRIHTSELTRYKVADNVNAVDFPGLDSLENHRSMFAQFGQMNNLFIYVMPYNGSPSENLVANVRAAYAMQKQAGNAARTLFCINKCGEEGFKDDLFDDEYKKEFVGKIRDEITDAEFKTEKDSSLQKLAAKLTDTVANSNVSDLLKEIREKQRELKEYTLKNMKEDDFMFTDQLRQDPDRGIKGPKEVKAEIKRYLSDMQIYSTEELAGLF